MPKISLDDKYALTTTRAYMTGIEALVRLPILQHQRDLDRGLNTAGFISGYRGSPLGSVDQAMLKAKGYLDQHNIVFQPAINEDLAATAVWGSQQVNLFEGAKYDGVFSMWYGKGPGVDRSMDVMKHANAFGTSRFGGVLAIAGDDHASKSSTLPHQSEHMFIGASIPVLNPANVQEVLDLGILGWELSRYCGCWVALKAITDNMDSAISADIDPKRVQITYPTEFELPADGLHGRLDESPLEQEKRLNKYRIYAAREFAKVNGLNRVVIDSPRARLGIITTGKAHLDVMQALEDLGIDEHKASLIGLRVLKIGMSWPLEPTSTHAFAEGLDEILVVEEKRSIIEDQLTGQLYNWPVERRPKVVGEFDEFGTDLLPNRGELTPAMIARVIAGRLSHFYQDPLIEKQLQFYEVKEQSLAQTRPKIERTPHYCSGCPHSRGTQVPDGSLAFGGIGCHYMGTWQVGARKAHTFSQMGGEGATWIGQAAFTETNHVFQNLGDGTYFHSGILAIRQAVSARVNITYKILYNDAIAMTGGQAFDGDLSVNDIVAQVMAEGVKRVAIVSEFPKQFTKHYRGSKGISVHPRGNLLEVERELREINGTTVLIFDQACAAKKRRTRKRENAAIENKLTYINPEVCEGCGDCGTQSNCLSLLPLETALGRKRKIDQSACNKDFSCLDGFCPSFLTLSAEGTRKNNSEPLTQDVALPEPILAPIDSRPWNILITGIGGTGVLTVSALISMAAHIEGKGCATMNQTGLAQKFGAVVSHVRIGASQDKINSVRIPAGDADLLLGCDLVVSAGDEALAKVNIERSNAIVNDYESITAEFISNPDLAFPAQEMKDTICEEIGSQKVAFINATALSEGLMGDTVAGNILLLGYAYQVGLIPVGAAAIKEAIELNGVAVKLNQQAFDWGRKAALDLDSTKNLAGISDERASPLRLEDIIEDRRARLVTYQNVSYADQYAQVLEQAMRRDRDEGDGTLRLSKAIAEQLYRAMAYKDEYEVARLHLQAGLKKTLARQFINPRKISYYLSPPLISRVDPNTGRPQKIAIPAWIITPFFRVLAGLKGLRGTPFDIFGFSSERKHEKRFLSDCLTDIEGILANLSTQNYDIACDWIGALASVRGFGPVKADSMKRYSEKRSEFVKIFNRAEKTEGALVMTPTSDGWVSSDAV